MRTFGKFAKDQISQLGKSQKDLAEELGVSPAYISQIFTGKKNPPDLGKPRNRSQLRTWCQFLGASEEDILDLVRYELHRIPPPPNPKFRNMRRLLLQRLDNAAAGLIEEIHGMELHPAENLAVQAMVQIYLVLQEENVRGRAYGTARFKDFCDRARTNRDFVEGELVSFFQQQPFSWSWDTEISDVRFLSESVQIRDATKRLRGLVKTPGLSYPLTVPVVAHVSAGEGFEYTDGGYTAGEGFDQVEIPPGVDHRLAQALYCVKVRGDSLREFFGDGTLLFIKPESWEEIKDGDLVIFKDRNEGKAFVKKVEFAGDNLILKSMNPLYKNTVLAKSGLLLLERVMAIVL
jgi:SOS-response transcriptional repressor LexA/transcriptional regulator with XRE-family HTH domain